MEVSLNPEATDQKLRAKIFASARVGEASHDVLMNFKLRLLIERCYIILSSNLAGKNSVNEQ